LRTSRRLLCVIFLSAISPSLRADVITFPNGDKISGAVIEENDDSIRFQSDLFGEISFPVSIATLVRDTKSDLIDERNTTLPAPEGSSRAPDSTDEPLNTGFLSRLSRFDVTENWKSNLTLGYTLLNGTRNREDIAIRFETERTGGKNRIRIDSRYDYGTQTNDGITKRNSDRYSTAVRWRRDFATRLFLQSDSRYLKDQVKDIDDKIEQSIGLGWRVLNEKGLKASFTPSLTIRAQDIRAVEEEISYLTTLFQDFTYKFGKRYTVYEETRYSVDPADSSSYTLDTLVELQAELSEKINLNLRYEFDFDNQLAPGVGKAQEKVFLGLGYAF
jgi:putative salt-induced outer membrane protein YdiY